MIGISREGRATTAALDKLYGKRVKPPKVPLKSEYDSVIERILEHREAVAQGKKEESDFTFPYKRYSDREVVQALRDLFHGKCAYCESRYAGTQPMDVEHWRPKGEVREPGEPGLKPGYYWLAAEWTNLLPSCIDCNRGRRLFDKSKNKNVVLGKKNQFPVEGQRLRRHEDDPQKIGAGETPLLINPCLEDPEKLLHYDEQGLILPKSTDKNSTDYKRAKASIRVYALNRGDLVTERLAVILGIDHRVKLISGLGNIRAALEAGSPQEAEAIGELISTEIDELLKMTDAKQPHAGLARQFIREADPTLKAAKRKS